MVTVGVSDLPMKAPAGEEDRRHQELLTYLPPEWDVDFQRGDEAWWPGRVLKTLGNFVHQYETFLGPGHTIALAEPPEPFVPGTLLTTALCLEPPEKDMFDRLVINGRPCRFLWVCPITTAEAKLKLDQGTDALVALMKAQHLPVAIDPKRKDLVTGQSPPAD